MKLEQLLEGVPFTLVQGSLDTEVQDIIYDSRKAAPGLAFVCIVGTQRDSHEFAADCAAKGVSVLVIQHDIDLSAMPGVTVVKVESSRYAMALMSGNLFGNPSRQMTMIGVTGTKGKTTTTHMIKSVLEAAGKKVGMIGTNGIYFMGRHQETANTTPESYELQKTFRQFLDAGCDVALMEVSSQGLMMDRVAGVHYDIGVFTNLSPDHIGPGEHKTFEEYRSWKGQLFRRCDVGVVNIDDENTEALLEGHTCKLVTYGRSEKADYRAEGCELLRTHDFLGVAFHVSGRDNMDVRVNMPGEFSVYNALAALAVGKVLGLPDAAIHEGLGKCVVKGRVELVPISKKFTILLDYAHNEVSTESLLTTLRAYNPHRLVVVFGCGGNRGNQVLCLAGVVVEATCNAVFQEAEVESDVPGSSCFPFQIGHIGTGTVGMNVSVTHAGFRTVLALSVDRQVIIIADTVLLSGHTIAGTELQVTQYFIVFQERFFCHSPA